MADIKVKDLVNHNASGTDLFSDSENFMIELNDDSEQILGGIGCRPCIKYSWIWRDCPTVVD
jgi:hypothetical protein